MLLELELDIKRRLDEFTGRTGLDVSQLHCSTVEDIRIGRRQRRVTRVMVEVLL